MADSIRNKYPFQIEEAYDAIREAIGSGLRKRLETPQQLPPEIALLLVMVTDHSDDRCWRSF